MPVFPPKVGFGEGSVYPRKDIMDTNMGVIGVPYVHGWYERNVVGPLKGLTSFRDFREAQKEAKRRSDEAKRGKPEPVPRPAGQAHYMATKEYVSDFWKECNAGDENSIGAFYTMLSRRLEGIPVMEVPYRDIERHSMKKPGEGRYVGGLCDMYFDGRLWKPSRILVARTDDECNAIHPTSRMAAAYHEYGHGSGAVSERDAQEIAIWAAIKDQNLAVSGELIEMLKTDDYFS